MSGKWPGGFIKKTAPTVVGPVDGEGGSASGIWTLDQAADYEQRGLWPMPIIQKPMWAIGGYNATKQLGLNTTTNMSSPVQIGSAVTWKTLSCGWYSSMAIKTNGTLWVWGNNNYGQLGNGTTTNGGVPAQLGALTTWLGLSGGYVFSLAVKTDGKLYGTGYNGYGQLGQGNTTNLTTFTQIGSLTTWLKVAASYQNSYAIKTDGTLWAWGQNTYGQIGDGTSGTNRSSPVQVGALTNWAKLPPVAGFYFCAAIKTDGTLWTWGVGTGGQLGHNNTTTYSSPVQVGALTTWAEVACGRTYMLAVKTDGTLWAWGTDNGAGNLGTGSSTNYSSPIQVGALTTWASISTGSAISFGITTGGALWAWGDNQGAVGALGLGDTTRRSSPVQVGASTNWSVVRNGQVATLAIENI